ncbi:MAG: ral stress protein [Myxococcaceae bacterium]|nr:ral stress protein [Myxococcaceae bacterium]
MIADENNAGGTEQSSEQSNTPDTTTMPEPQTASTDGQASATPVAEERRPRRRGFAAMDRDRVKEIASKGGKAAHAAGTAHQFSSDEARNAGRKGGMAPHVRRGGVRRRPTEAAATTPQPGEQSGDSGR